MTTEELAEAQSEAHAEFRELAVDYWGINKDNGWRSVCYGNGLFVAVAHTGSGNRVMKALAPPQ